MITKISKGIGSVVIVLCLLAVWMIVTWAVVAEPDGELPAAAPIEPVHTVKQSFIGCDVILDTIIVDDEEYFLALCNKPKIIESDM